MDFLPLELIDRIANFLSFPESDQERSTKPRQADLALISKRWRGVIENRTFSSIEIKSTELQTFADVYGGRTGIERRACLHELTLTFVPPEHIDAASRICSRVLRSAKRRRNNEAFTAAIRTLFTTLSSWSYDQTYDRAIAFEILDPPNVHPCKKVKLLAPETIPLVRRITGFRNADNMINIGSLPLIASRLPALQEFNWETFEHNEPLNSVRTRRDRYRFAKHLRMLANSSIRHAWITMHTDTPNNEDIEVPSLLLPDSSSDHLSLAFHRFSQLQSLSNLDIHEAVISPTLFWPSGIDAARPYWPNLTVLHVSFNRMAADGGWYFEQNPHASPNSDDDRVSFNSNFESMPPTPERIFAEEEILARTANFTDDSELSLTDIETEEQEGAIYDTSHWFRTWPSAKMEDLLHSMAQAVTMMPKLKCFFAGADMPLPGMSGISFEFFYLNSGEQLDLGYPEFEHNNVSKSRLLWRSPRLWQMSEPVERLWRNSLGQDGIIEYQDWDD